METLIDYFKEQIENNMELYFFYNGINYHLDYDEHNDDSCYVFDDDTGAIYYDGKICDILDNFIIAGKTFRELLLSEAFDITI